MTLLRKISLSIGSVLLFTAICSEAAEVPPEYGFVSLSRTTKLALSNDLMSGRYTTKVNGLDIFGQIWITQTLQTEQTRTVSGTFRDQYRDNICSGNFELVIREGDGFTYSAQARWEIIHQQDTPDCADPTGTVFELSLIEAIPATERSGDYTVTEANQLPSYTSGEVTWPRWRVVDHEGLNCRLGDAEGNPIANGDVYSILPFGLTFNVDYPRAPSAVEMDRETKKPYIRLNYAGAICWVRAHRNYVQPVSLMKTLFAGS
ncbi:MAG: hypothetical protein R3227_15475 [Reinekea sp.]|nr:hypothetical protein [Reinekea sp.]